MGVASNDKPTERENISKREEFHEKTTTKKIYDSHLKRQRFKNSLCDLAAEPLQYEQIPTNKDDIEMSEKRGVSDMSVCDSLFVKNLMSQRKRNDGLSFN